MTDKATPDTAPTLKTPPSLKTPDAPSAVKHDPPAPKATAKAEKEEAPHPPPPSTRPAGWTPNTPAVAPDAPILPGYEGDGTAYETVILTQGTIDQGAHFRIAKTPELPLSLAMGGARYLIANHAQKLYVWQVK